MSELSTKRRADLDNLPNWLDALLFEALSEIAEGGEVVAIAGGKEVCARCQRPWRVLGTDHKSSCLYRRAWQVRRAMDTARGPA